MFAHTNHDTQYYVSMQPHELAEQAQYMSAKEIEQLTRQLEEAQETISKQLDKYTRKGLASISKRLLHLGSITGAERRIAHIDTLLQELAETLV